MQTIMNTILKLINRTKLSQLLSTTTRISQIAYKFAEQAAY
jgi:hypothetical protein